MKKNLHLKILKIKLLQILRLNTKYLSCIFCISRNLIYKFFKKIYLKVKRYTKKLDKESNERIRFTAYFVFFLFIILNISLFYTCNIHPKKNNKYTLGINNNGDRIKIIDRNGHILANDYNSYDLYFRPFNVLNVEEEILKIIKLLPKIKNKYDKILTKALEKKYIKNASILIQFGLSGAEKKALLDGGVIGIEFQEKKSRYYVHDGLFSHILGVVSDDGIGISGIEKSISQGMILPENDSVELSLDVQIQRLLYDCLQDLMQNNQANGAFGMIANIENGEIIAAVSLPDYNPNDKSSMTFDRVFNKFSLGVYEFGSIFKLINTALALKHGFKLDKIYDIADDLEIGNWKISEMKKGIGEKMTIEEIAMYSSNIGSGKIALDIGATEQRNFFYELGFGEKMNLELPENGGFILPSKSRWNGIASVTLSYGHGIAVTQAHLLRAMISILNDGKFTNLTLLKSKNKLFLEKEILTKDIANQMKGVMRNVVQFGAGRKIKSEFYDIGGKSGTAIKINLNGKYSKEKNLLSIFAAFPMKKPKYAIILSLDEPKWNSVKRMSLTGGGVLGYATRDLIEEMGFFLKIPIMTENDKNLLKAEKLLRNLH